jgi:hypothetical protein
MTFLLGHEVFCFEYEHEADAGRVWEAGRDHPELRHVSIWRTRTQTGDRWFVVVADQSGGAARRLLDFAPGTERELSEDEVLSFLERRLKLALEGEARGETEVSQSVRYGRRGARLERGGNLRQTIGGDE